MAALCISAAAQVPNDWCSGAIPVFLGSNGPFSNIGAASTAPWPAGCLAGYNFAGGDVWFKHVATHTASIEVSTCGADFSAVIMVLASSSGTCGTLLQTACSGSGSECFPGVRGYSVTFAATAGETYYIRVGGANLFQQPTSGTFPLDLRLDFDIEAVAEAVPGSGVLGAGGGAFFDNDFIRWNYSGSGSVYSGQPAAVVMNFGRAGSGIPLGVTAQIPGFDQLWAGSVPAGFALFPFGPALVGIGDFSINVGTIFGPGDRLRIQGLVLDPSNPLGGLPVVPTKNTITFTKMPTCAVLEDFESVAAPGPGVFPAGWSDGGGARVWSSNTGTTPSGATGPLTGAYSGSVYVYCETSSASAGDTYVLDSPLYSNAGITGAAMQLSRVGSTIGTLEVYLDDGSGTFPSPPIAAFSGGNADWELVLLPLPATLPANLQFRFVYTRGSSFFGDLAIDDFCLF